MECTYLHLAMSQEDAGIFRIQLDDDVMCMREWEQPRDFCFLLFNKNVCWPKILNLIQATISSGEL